MPLDLAKKQTRFLAEISWGSTPTYLRLTDWPAVVSYGGNTYVANCELQIDLPPNTVGFDEKPLVLTLPSSWLEADLVNGIAFPPTWVTLRQQILVLSGDPQVSGEVDTTNVLVYRARLEHVRRSASGRANLVRLEFRTAKARLQVPLGSPSNYHCKWTLFGRGCGLAQVVETATMTLIDTVDDKKVTLTDFTNPMVAPGGTPGRFWHRGYLERDGLRIAIREWSTGAVNTFHLARRPPSSWLNVTNGINLVAGCDKTIETCRERWDNEEHFAGTAYEQPDYHPVHEQP